MVDGQALHQCGGLFNGVFVVPRLGPVKRRLKGARIRLAEAEATLMAKTRAAARATDAYVHESPWTAVGVAAGVGLLLGLVLSRR